MLHSSKFILRNAATAPFQQFLPLLLLLFSCSATRQAGGEKKAAANLLKDSALTGSHIGICVYEPASGKFLYQYQDDHYFVPASNTKLFTCYAAMKYLGDSLTGIRYENDMLQPTGDPTLLHPDFPNQPVVDFLQSDTTKRWKLVSGQFNSNAWGRGWSWDDYSDDYMAERSALPVFGNVYRFTWNDTSLRMAPSSVHLLKAPLAGNENKIFNKSTMRYGFKRNMISNDVYFTFENGSRKSYYTDIPFRTSYAYSQQLLHDTIKGLKWNDAAVNFSPVRPLPYRVYSQPTDSVLAITMHRSDNFFAEQLLQMVSFEKLGSMNDRKLIDTLLKTDLALLPQVPVWVDGSGLSRYNLVTPRSFVMLLRQIHQEFGIERLKRILPTGGTGTLSGLYTSLAGRLFAKTGTLSGHVALSGFLYTKKNKLLIFSILVNNHNSSAAEIRRAIERFVVACSER